MSDMAVTKSGAYDAGPSKNSQKPEATEPSNSLRMCHLRHLTWKQGYVVWGIPPKTGGESDLVDDYFVPKTSSVYMFGGPVHPVTFAKGAIQEVMACQASKCKICGNKETVKKAGKIPDLSLPVIHREEYKADGDGGGMHFWALFTGARGCPDVEKGRSSVMVTFRRGGDRGTSAVTTETILCAEGKCNCKRKSEIEIGGGNGD